MKIVLGPCHPHLEDALADEIRARRARDPLAPLLLVAPSDTLRQRVKVLLAQERGLPLLNFHVYTFARLSRTLFDEAHGPAEPTLRDEVFMEEALKQVLLAVGGRFAPLADNDGGCAALWQSLRDLKDAQVDPAQALDALQEGLFGARDREALGDLFTLYREVKRRFPQWQARDPQDLDAALAQDAPASAHLRQFERIYYYGFYDLTQSQLELFQSIAGSYPVTLFHPLAQGDPDWSFAQEFFDRHLRGLAGADEVVDLLAEGARPGGAPPGRPAGPPARPRQAAAVHRPRRETVNCAGPRDEILTVAKKVLRLVEDEGFDFRHVGVAARVLEPWLPWIRDIFPAHGIPFHTPARQPLRRFNRVRAVLTLLDLPVQDYPRAGVIDLLSCHDLDFRALLGRRAEPRPHVWDVVTRTLRINHGMADWRRLERYLDSGLRLGAVDDEEGRPLSVAPWQIRLLLDTVNALHEQLSALPAEARWSELADGWRALIGRLLKPAPDESEGGAAAGGVTEAIDEALDGLAALEEITPTASLETFARRLRGSLERASARPDRNAIPGVQVLDAGRARGIPFRALFLVGMNEGVFPRNIREDPFLRDPARTVLERDLGCKVAPKLAGYGEEKLLFALLSGSASDHLCYSYQRSDADGRSLAPSWYLRETDAGPGAEAPGAEAAIPKSTLGKASAPPFDQDRWLVPEELAVRRALRGEDPAPLVRLSGASVEGFARGAAAIRALEDADREAGRFDGLTGPLEEWWNGLVERGVSPTALESYGHCPFKYFARNVLGLQRQERPEQAAPVQVMDWGKICHEILQQFHQDAQRAWGDDWSTWLDESAAEVFADFEEHYPTGRPVEWETAREDLVAMLREVVRADLDEMRDSGFRPVGFETALTARLGEDWPPYLRDLPLHGRLDRIDHEDQQGRGRVIDYKYKTGSSPGTEDNNPLLAAIRGQRLQLPIYTLLAAGAEGPAPGAAVAACYYFLASRWADGPLVRRNFPAEVWGKPSGRQVRNAVARLLNGIRAGEFFIMPDTYCGYCEVSEICRKDHFPSVGRAKRLAAAEALTRMRKAKLAKD